MRPIITPGVAKVVTLPSFAPPLKKLEFNSTSGQKNRAAPVFARRYWATLFQVIVCPNPFEFVTGSDPPAVEVKSNSPNPLPTASVGVTTAQQLPLVLLPVGIVAAKKAVIIALPCSSLLE